MKLIIPLLALGLLTACQITTTFEINTPPTHIPDYTIDTSKPDVSHLTPEERDELSPKGDLT